jgi:lipoprotein-anchoring transpeptidase ErfK/SrfK
MPELNHPLSVKLTRRRFVTGVMGILLGLFGATTVTAAGGVKAERRGKWVEILLAEQRLVAWEDGRMVMSTPVSTGTRKTPTPRGTFRIYRKYAKQRMSGPGYDLPNVPWVMYFRKGGYALHGTYWHNNFGRPMSHGCVNLPIGEAAWLYQWAPNGTAVVVR